MSKLTYNLVNPSFIAFADLWILLHQASVHSTDLIHNPPTSFFVQHQPGITGNILIERTDSEKISVV